MIGRRRSAVKDGEAGCHMFTGTPEVTDFVTRDHPGARIGPGGTMGYTAIFLVVRKMGGWHCPC
jgi:hypothetical protein